MTTLRRSLVALLAVLGLTATMGVAATGPATAAVPKNGVYEDHNNVAYFTHLKFGCQYAAKAGWFSDGQVDQHGYLVRDLHVTGQYLYEPPSGCHTRVLLRLWSKRKGVKDIRINLEPGEDGDFYRGHDLAPRRDRPGWKFVLMEVQMYPASRGLREVSTVSVVYDVNPCLKYPAVCAPFSNFKEKNGYGRS